ncbi:MAG: hypothetical protein AMS24_00735 [Chlamydiae bacterium SM23_39]|nr:MAG: hypothetical protein AMS24_00735 [Chlamydiae bacterium SM23_39]
MEWIDRFDFFLFDLDGLLVNTEHIHFQAYKNMCYRRGCILDCSFQDFCNIAHATEDGLKLYIYSKFPNLYQKEPRWEVLYKEKNNLYFELLKSSKIELMKGAYDLLKILNEKNKNSCVVTNSLKEQTDLIKGNIPILKVISHWITREDYIKPKPNPEGYFTAIKLYSKKGDKIIGFEDTIKGLKALINTSALCVLISPSNYPPLNVILPREVFHFESLEDIKDSFFNIIT